MHEKLIQFYQGFKIDAHPMSIMVGVVGALSSFFHDPEKHSWKDPNEQYITAIRLIAKMPTIAGLLIVFFLKKRNTHTYMHTYAQCCRICIYNQALLFTCLVAAFAYKYAKGERIVYPKSKFGYGENFLYMMFGLPTEEYKVDPLMARAMEIILLLHCDHEQNASTSTVRIAGSSQANPYACIAAGIASLWGRTRWKLVVEMTIYMPLNKTFPVILMLVSDRAGTWRSKRGRLEDVGTNRLQGPNSRIYCQGQGQR